MKVALASAVAIALAGSSAWGHTFPPVHTVVVQVERCELAVLIGYTAGSGEPTERIVARVASQPKSHMVETLRETLAAYAMTPLTIAVDGQPLVPTSLHAKIGLDAGGTRPVVVVLATYALPDDGKKLTVRSRDPRTTRISWQDRGSGRVDASAAPAQDHWYSDVASFLLPLTAPGGSACVRSSLQDSGSAASPPASAPR